MAKNIQRKPYTFVAAENQKISPIATAPINLPGLKVKTDFQTVYKCRESLKRFPAFDVLNQDFQD